MIKLLGVGRGKRAEETTNDTTGVGKKQPGEIRMQTELSELDLPKQAKIRFPSKDDLLNFYVTISPDEGYWKGAAYEFKFVIKPLYPHDAPKVKCETPVFHPNIDKEGNVCLNILREDWKPVLSISAVIYGLLHLFLEPNPNDPLNHEAAEELRRNADEFDRLVANSLRGGLVQGVQYPKLVKTGY